MQSRISSSLFQFSESHDLLEIITIYLTLKKHSNSYRIDPRDSQKSERRPVTHCEAFTKAVGSDGNCVKRDNFWPAAHKTLAVVAQDHRVFPEGQPISHDKGHVAMLMCLRHVEETVVPVIRPCVGGSMSSRNANDGRLPSRAGEQS